MSTAHHTPSSPMAENDLSVRLNTALAFLRSKLHLVDPALPDLVAVLCSVGADERWHKDDCFLGHLIDVYHILKLRGAPDPVARCGLFHFVYSNSYVDLAIFDPALGGRDLLSRLIGPSAECLVHLFCIVPRHSLIHDSLLFCYEEDELIDHLSQSALSFHPAEPWRVKMQSVLPTDGIVVTSRVGMMCICRDEWWLLSF